MCVDTFTNISNAIFHSARPIHVWWVFDLMVDTFRWKAWINVICIACIHIRNTYNLGSIDRKEFPTKLNQQTYEWKSMQRTCTHTSLSLLFDEKGPQGQPPSNLFNVNSAKCFAAHNSYYFHLEFRIHITLLLASPFSYFYLPFAFDVDVFIWNFIHEICRIRFYLKIITERKTESYIYSQCTMKNIVHLCLCKSCKQISVFILRQNAVALLLFVNKIQKIRQI